jgi:hypothetical protein
VPDLYTDRWITCTPDEIVVRAYYFPWGSKHIPYTSIRTARRQSMTTLRGRGRIWGTAHPRYWASLDPGRPRKTTAFVLDLGRRIQPFLTPEDPDAVQRVLREHDVPVQDATN